MIALVGAVFVASLLGSAHCAGMCGGFLLFAVGMEEGRRAGRTALQAAYNIGRLVTYLTLGALAGALGAALDMGGAMLGVQRVAAAVAGSLMVLFGVAALLRIAGVALPRASAPRALRRLAEAGHRAAASLPPVARAGSVGLLTTLLPCGWLYAFVITAAGTGGALAGAIVMLVFWTGTLPMMVALGTGVQAATGALRRRLPAITSLAIVIVGLFTVAGRLSAPAIARPRGDDGAVRVTGAAAVERVRALDAERSPCCAESPGAER